MVGTNRRVIERDAPREYLGNRAIRREWEQALEIDALAEMAYLAMWISGGRIEETLRLMRRQIDWDDVSLTIQGMMVEKRRKKFWRDVYVARDDKDPLVERFIERVEGCDTEYLMPSYRKRDSWVSQFPVYKRIVKIREPLVRSGTLWPHLIRDQRAFFMKEVRGLDIYELKEWFAWARIEQPAHYVGNPTQESIKRKLGFKSTSSYGSADGSSGTQSKTVP